MHVLKNLVTIVSIFLSLTTFGQVMDETVFREGVYDRTYISRNRIVTITTNCYINNNMLSPDEYHFDTSGMFTKQRTIDSNETRVTGYSFVFNKQHDLALRITHQYETGKIDTVNYNRVYENGLLVKENLHGTSLVVQYKYNEKGQRIESVHPYYGGYAQVSRRVVRNEYDHEGRLIHVTDQVLQGDSDTVQQWMSDRKITYEGNRIKRISEKIPNGDLPTNQGNMEYSYDSRGNLTSVVSDAVVSRYYTYNEQGLLISKLEKMPEGLDELSELKIVTHYHYSFWK